MSVNYISESGVHDSERLKELQSLPLNRKIAISQARIVEWYNNFDGNVFVSLSGGKDSTVLLDLVRKLFPDVPAVFSNTGLEYPEIREFARSKNATVVYPEMNFHKVITTYGYPIIGKEVAVAIHYARRIIPRDREKNKEVIRKRLELLGKRPSESGKNFWDNVKMMTDMGEFGKTKSQFNKEKWLPIARDMPFLVSHYCCNVMKKRPINKYQKQIQSYPFLGTMAEESRMRKQVWLRHGCNAFDGKKISSQPLAFWTEQDILEYIKRYNLQICSVYGDIEILPNGKLHCTGCQRTGCMFCGFGAHSDKHGDERFLRLKETHPKQYDYCINGGKWSDNSFYDSNANTEPDEMGWVNWNPKRIWTPSSKGLGMGYVFDMLNDVYGEDFIRYK